MNFFFFIPLSLSSDSSLCNEAKKSGFFADMNAARPPTVAAKERTMISVIEIQCEFQKVTYG